jgi:hypothetical protein
MIAVIQMNEGLQRTDVRQMRSPEAAATFEIVSVVGVFFDFNCVIQQSVIDAG